MLNNKKIIVISVIIITILFLIYLIYKNNFNYSNEINLNEILQTEDTNKEINQINNIVTNTINATQNNEIIVHITGEVKKEGVIHLNKGDRIIDAIKKAGGETKQADLSQVNLAYELQDGQKIYIPNKNEKISNFTKELIKLNYISKDEYNLTYYDNLFKEYKDNGYSNHELFMSIHYITKRIKENKFLDEDGNIIRNKFGYFKSALESNFKKLQGYSDYEDEYDWLADNEDLINNYNLSKLSNKNKDRER